MLAYGDALHRKNDAIVNLANNALSHGAGIAKAIKDATGGEDGDYNLLC